MRDLVEISDEDYKNQLRINRVNIDGLKSSKNITVAKKVAMFLCILAHPTKNRYVKFQFKCSGPTVSKHFHVVLQYGTYIDVHVPTTNKGRYRNRKGQVSVNVLGVCDMTMEFVYVLTGNYYLCDNEYPNCEGFLIPYKGVRYHLSGWSSRRL
ncbi:hypothetical protein ACS0TY_030181 [Phlomoides rotata]